MKHVIHATSPDDINWVVTLFDDVSETVETVKCSPTSVKLSKV